VLLAVGLAIWFTGHMVSDIGHDYNNKFLSYLGLAMQLGGGIMSGSALTAIGGAAAVAGSGFMGAVSDGWNGGSAARGFVKGAGFASLGLIGQIPLGNHEPFVLKGTSDVINGGTGIFADRIHNLTYNAKTIKLFGETGMKAMPGVYSVWQSVASTSDDFIGFNGKQVVWYNSEGQVIELYRAVSGFRGYQNPKFASLSNLGPIPEGAYNINLTLDPNRFAQIDASGNLYSNNGIERIPEGFLDSNPWGTFRARLNPLPGTNTYGRTNFYIHNSSKGYTHGCIEIESAFFNKLLDYRKIHSSITLYVNY